MEIKVGDKFRYSGDLTYINKYPVVTVALVDDKSVVYEMPDGIRRLYSKSSFKHWYKKEPEGYTRFIVLFDNGGYSKTYGTEEEARQVGLDVQGKFLGKERFEIRRIEWRPKTS